MSCWCKAQQDSWLQEKRASDFFRFRKAGLGKRFRGGGWNLDFLGGRPQKGVFCEKGWTFFRARNKFVSLIMTIFSELERWLLLNHYVEWEEKGPTSWQKDSKHIFADALELRSGLCFFDAKNRIIEVQWNIITPLSFPLWEHVFRIAGKHRCELVCLPNCRGCVWRYVRPNATPSERYTKGM